MKILFITSRLPYPPMGGDKVRTFNFIKHLSKNNSISLISFIESEKESKYIDNLKVYCDSVEVILLKPFKSYLNCFFRLLSLLPLQISYYYSFRMKKKIDEILSKEKFNGIYVHLLRMAHYAKDAKRVYKVLDLTDAISLSLRRSLRYRKPLAFIVYLLEWLRVKRYEKKIINSFDRCLLVSPVDKEIIETAFSAKNITVVSNGVDFDYFKPNGDNYDPRNIVFLGNMHSFPNQDAVFYFYKSILPLIKEEVPDVKFYIVGINCSNKIKKLNKDKNIVVVSGVEDVRPYLMNSAVLVCPIRVGAGIQNKILEATALGVPVVTSSVGFEGLCARKDKDIIVADKPEEFAQKVKEIMKRRDYRQEIAQNGRKFIIQNYSWQKEGQKLESIFQDSSDKGLVGLVR